MEYPILSDAATAVYLVFGSAISERQRAGLRNRVWRAVGLDQLYHLSGGSDKKLQKPGRLSAV